MVDLDAYFARIGYRGPATPTLATLRALHELHPAAIVFEAMDVQLGRGVDLAPAAVDAKLLGGGRGGYCFEQNGLFKRVLKALGFEVESLMARIAWMVPPDAPAPPRAHLALRVTIDGESWLADVGFGGCVPTAPLRFASQEPQATAHEALRFVATDGGALLQARRNDVWLPLYEVMHAAQIDSDFEMMNWYTATHPASPFKRFLMAARATPQARFALRDNRLTVRAPDGRTEQRVLDADALAQAMHEVFGLAVQPDWRPVIERVARAG